MGLQSSEETEIVIDLDSVENAKTCEQVVTEGNNLGIRPREAALCRNWSSFDQNTISEGAEGLLRVSSSTIFGRGEYGEDFADKRMIGDDNVVVWDKTISSERPRKNAVEKHPKPPLPPKSLSVSAADQVLIREISELSMLKRARAARMKEAKRKKKNKASSSNTNLCAMVVTIIFCLIIIWQAF